MRRMRSRMQIIFQDPLASLNPRMTLGLAIEHPAQIHMPELSTNQRRNRVLEILHAVGMNPPEAFYNYSRTRYRVDSVSGWYWPVP